MNPSRSPWLRVGHGLPRLEPSGFVGSDERQPGIRSGSTYPSGAKVGKGHVIAGASEASFPNSSGANARTVVVRALPDDVMATDRGRTRYRAVGSCLSRQSRNHTGRFGKHYPRLYGQFLDDPPIHIRSDFPRAAGANEMEPCGFTPFRRAHHPSSAGRDHQILLTTCHNCVRKGLADPRHRRISTSADATALTR